MQTIDTILHSDAGKAQFMRFVLNGCLAAGIHYAIYFLLQLFIEVNVSYAIGYIGKINTFRLPYPQKAYHQAAQIGMHFHIITQSLVLKFRCA